MTRKNNSIRASLINVSDKVASLRESWPRRFMRSDPESYEAIKELIIEWESGGEVAQHYRSKSDLYKGMVEIGLLDRLEISRSRFRSLWEFITDA